MRLTALCEMEMHYTWIDFVDYGVGGQYLGALEGTVKGERLRGCGVPSSRSTSRHGAPTTSTVQPCGGIIYTDDGAKIYFEFNGIALLRSEDSARVFTTSLSLRTGDAGYAWLNDTVGAVEGILNTTTDQAIVRAFTRVNQPATVHV